MAAYQEAYWLEEENKLRAKMPLCLQFSSRILQDVLGLQACGLNITTPFPSLHAGRSVLGPRLRSYLRTDMTEDQ